LVARRPKSRPSSAVCHRFGDNDFTVLSPGNFVRCAVSGERIPLDELRYWSVDLQEAYRGPEEAMGRWKSLQESQK
jgi:hypothetical protein